MNAIEIEGLCKEYPSFALKNVSFCVPKGSITGFIGRNGAGKSTTLKAMLNLVSRSAGKIRINGYDLAEQEPLVKKTVGFVDGTDYFPSTKISVLTKVTKRFYKDWDEETYRTLLEKFEIDEKKKIKELSTGMKVKYAMATALSHHAKTLILDEPTGGLDPASRDDLVRTFEDFVSDGEHSILFSTHITGDLEKCADNIIYIRDGIIIKNSSTKDFKDSWKMLTGKADFAHTELKRTLIGLHESKGEFDALIKSDDLTSEIQSALQKAQIHVTDASIEDIMVHLERRS